MTDADQSLDLDALLDPVRLAAAWQIARERPAAVSEAHEEEVSAGDDGDAFAAEPTDAGEQAPEAALPVALTHQQLVDEIEHTLAAEPTDAGEPAREAPLPVALAHQQLLDEIEHTLAAVPAIAAKAHRVLAAPLAQLAQVIDPVDLAAAEVALDQLEDLWQALLSDAGWPRIPHRNED